MLWQTSRERIEDLNFFLNILVDKKQVPILESQ